MLSSHVGRARACTEGQSGGFGPPAGGFVRRAASDLGARCASETVPACAFPFLLFKKVVSPGEDGF